jgi:hypothetical protein
MRHFVEHQKKLASEKRPKKKPESGEKPPTDLERVWEYLKTEENRAYALLLLDDAVSEESQKRQRGKNTWGKTDRERKQKQSALKKTRATVEKQGTALIAALHAHLAETKAIAPLARLQFSFPHSSEAQKHVLAAECDNPGEIAFCIKDIQAAIERFRHLEDYDPAPKGPGQKGREKSKTGEVMGELDCLFRDLLPSKRQAQKFTQFLFYATGIEPDDDWGEWTGRIDRIRKQRMSSP